MKQIEYKNRSKIYFDERINDDLLVIKSAFRIFNPKKILIITSPSKELLLYLANQNRFFSILDLEPNMLSECKKIIHFNKRDNFELLVRDMRNFELDVKHDLIYFSAESIQLLSKKVDLKNCLLSCKLALNQGGCIILNQYNFFLKKHTIIENPRYFNHLSPSDYFVNHFNYHNSQISRFASYSIKKKKIYFLFNYKENLLTKFTTSATMCFHNIVKIKAITNHIGLFIDSLYYNSSLIHSKKTPRTIIIVKKYE